MINVEFKFKSSSNRKRRIIVYGLVARCGPQPVASEKWSSPLSSGTRFSQTRCDFNENDLCNSPVLRKIENVGRNWIINSRFLDTDVNGVYVSVAKFSREAWARVSRGGTRERAGPFCGDAITTTETAASAAEVSTRASDSTDVNQLK